MRLLIVEDNRGAAEALCNLLTERMDHIECKIASTLAEGLKTAVEFNADITLLDLMLPGSAVDDVITSIPKFPPPVIVVTSIYDPDNTIMLKCFANRAQNYLSKGAVLNVIDSFEAKIESDCLVRAIIDSHFRHVLPQKLENGR